MSESPSLSVIIPVYNAQSSLPRCLDSLVNQTLLSLEIICVNDGSTDESSAILHAYAQRDERIVVVDQPNSGACGKPRNVGLRRARAPFVTFVDADDHVELNAYAELLPKMEDDIDLLCFGSYVENTSPEPYDDFYRSVLYIGEDTDKEMDDSFLFTRDPHAWNKIFRTQVIRTHEIFFPEGICGEDNSFFCAYCLFARRYRLCSQKYYHYVRSGDSYMGKLLNKQASRAAVDSIRSTGHFYKCLKRNRSFSRHKRVLFIYMAQRASFARCHSLKKHAWRIYLVLAEYAATIWLRSPGTVFSLLWNKKRTGSWVVPPTEKNA